MQRDRIEICGGIASGKTSLATVLHSPTTRSNFEDFSKNPFFENFYSNPSKFAFETELTFLLQHYSSINSSERSAGLVVHDFSMALDLAYASITLSDPDKKIFQGVFEACLEKLGSPKLIVHLSCSADVELQRIAKRGRAQETSIDLTYLNTLDESINSVLRSEYFRHSDILDINSEFVNFVSDQSEIDWSVSEVRRTIKHWAKR